MENVNYEELTAEMAMKWLDELISNMEQRRPLERLNGRIGTISTPSDIHVFTGVEELADVLGKELMEREDRGDEYLEYYFIYRDMKVFQLSVERLGKYAGRG